MNKYQHVYNCVYNLTSFKDFIEITDICEIFNIKLTEVTLEKLQHLHPDTIDGFTYFNYNEKCYEILINREVSKGRYYFTFFHEFGHIILGHFNARKYIENKEEEANVFARNMLIPHLDFAEDPKKYELYTTVSHKALEVKYRLFDKDDYYCRKILEEENYI